MNKRPLVSLRVVAPLLVLTILVIFGANSSAFAGRSLALSGVDIENSGTKFPDANVSAQAIQAFSVSVGLGQLDAGQTFADVVAANVGEVVTYKVDVEVTGGSLTNLLVTNVLPDDVDYLADNSGTPEVPGTFDPNDGVWDIGDVSDADGVVSLLVEASIRNVASEKTSFTNTANLFVDKDPSTDAPDATDDATVNLSSTDNLTVTVIHPEPSDPKPAIGDTFNYVIRVDIGALVPVTGFVLTHAITAPTGGFDIGDPVITERAREDVIDADFPEDLSGDITGVTLTVKRKDPNDTNAFLQNNFFELEVPVTVLETINASAIDSETRISSPDACGDVPDICKQLSTGIETADLGIDAKIKLKGDAGTGTDGTLEANVGDRVTYTVTVTNNGPDTADNVIVSIPVPDEVDFRNPASPNTPEPGSIPAKANRGVYTRSTQNWIVGTMVSGNSADLEIEVLIESRPTGGEISLTSEFDSIGNQFNPDTPNQNSDSVTIEIPQPAVTVDLSVTDEDETQVDVFDDDNADALLVNEGEEVTFTVTISNASGSDTATGVVAELTLPDLDDEDEGIRFLASDDCDGDAVSRVVTCDPVTLAAGEEAVFAISATVDSGTGDAGSKNFRESVVEITADQFIEDNTDTAAIRVRGADIQAAFTQDPVTVNPATSVATYVIEVTNLGPDDATGVKALHEITGGFTTSAASVQTTNNTPYNIADGVWLPGDISAGAAFTLRIEAQADSGTAEGTYPNTVSLDNSSLSPPDNGPDNNSDTASIVLGARSDLSITKTVDVNQAEVGDTVLYTIEVFNAGPDIAGGVIVRDVFPVGITLIDDGGNPNLIAGSKETPVGSESVFYDIRDDEWDIGDLEPGFGASIELGATVSSDAEGMPFITNTATITTPDVGLSDSAAFDIVASELNLDLRLRNMNNPNNAGDDGPLVNAPSGDPLTVAEGATIALVVGITNSGTLNAPGVEAEYAIPEGLTFDPAHTLSSGECSLAAPQTISCEFGDVSGGGGSVTREFAVIVNAGTLGETFENTVEITVPVPSDPGSVISDVAFIRVGGADLKVTNEVSNATPRDFETIKYTITVENLGPDDVSNVVIDDRFDASPAHLFWCVFQNNELFDIGPGGIDAETGTFEEKGNGLTNGGSLEWTIPSLPGGATSTLAITARVNICTVAESNSRGGITNTAKVTSFGGVPANSDPVSENNSSAVSITAFGLDTHLFFESLIIDSGDDLFPSDAAETILIDEVRPDGSIVTSNRPLSVFEASEGDNIQFLFFFGDEGGGVSSIPNVSIKSRLSNGLTFVSAFPSASHSNGTVTWSGLTADSTDRAVLLTVSVDGGTTDQELFVTTEISGLPFDGEDDSDPGNINLQFNPRDPDNNKMEDDEDAVVLKIRPVIVNALDDEGPGNPSPGSCTSGHCNLREAIAVANANAGVGVTSVVFEINGIGPHIIKLTSPLQIVQGQLSIDGGGNIILDGSEAGDGATGFQITGGGSTIKGMVINSFAGAGIVLSGSGGSVVEGNFIGTTDQGNEAKPNGNGIRMDNSSSNVIGGDSESHGNVISGNTVNGIVISGESSTLNEVKGNLIGLDKDGAEALPNGTGILINTGAKSNTIGGLTPGKRNVISGNTGDGVRLSGSGVQSNIVIGNFIGTNRDGAVPVPNGGNGVSITNGAVENAVGVSNGTGCVDGCNLISGNTGHGVAIFGSGVSRNTVKGNFIGTDTGGTFDIGNAKFGVSISSFASSNAVGGINGSCTGDCNVISGNDGGGVAIESSANLNSVSGNYIGTNDNGDASLGNGSVDEMKGDGVTITNALNNLIGFAYDETADAIVSSGNLILGNAGYGVRITGSGSSGNKAHGNLIGTDESGVTGLGNVKGGVRMEEGATANLIGGPIQTTPGGECSGECNVISGNGGDGLSLTSAQSINNVVRNNYIGTDKSGKLRLSNVGNGISITDSAGSSVGGNAQTGNVISGNTLAGIRISGATAANNLVKGNYVGLDSEGIGVIGNGGAGVHVSGGANGNIIGGAAAEDRNVISGNGSHGILIADAGTRQNTIAGNFVGTNANGTEVLDDSNPDVPIDFGNAGNGVSIRSAPQNTIGGSDSGAGNIIAGNAGAGIAITGAEAVTNIVRGNFIGTDDRSSRIMGNGSHGVEISGGASQNTIGGVVSSPQPNSTTCPGIDLDGLTRINLANTIAFNGGDGVFVGSGTRNAVQTNCVFGNGGIGINLATAEGQDDGPTPNDTQDVDDGPNHLQNFPFFSTVQLGDDGFLTVTYRLTSDPRAGSPTVYPVRVQFYKADTLESGEGRVLLGTDVYSFADFLNGFKSFNPGRAAVFGVVEGTPIVALATDASGNSSEFSPVVRVNEPMTFVVNTTSDSAGLDGICNQAECSLREAIQAANNNPNTSDAISFNIPTGDAGFDSDTGIFTIRLLSALPEIVSPVTIDGTTQPQFGISPIIELDGTSAGENVIGLHLLGGGSMVRGLILNRFAGDGIRLAANGGNVVEGNFIGTDYTGWQIEADDVEYGNGGNGVRIARSSNNVVGIRVNGNGSRAGSGNIISGNTLSGVAIFGEESTGNEIRGNSTGTDATGTARLGNLDDGISIIDASDNVIDSNMIAFNGGSGVHVSFSVTSTGNAILSNSIFANEGRGIDLESLSDSANGRTPNDLNDADSGPNNLQNFPGLVKARIAETEIDEKLRVQITYSVPSPTHGDGEPDPGRTNYPLRVEFFKVNPDDAGDKEGWVLIGSDVYTAGDALNDRVVTLDIDAVSLNVVSGDEIVATATDLNGNTSEFSDSIAAIQAAPNPPNPANPSPVGGVLKVVSTIDQDPDAGICNPAGECPSLRAAIEAVEGNTQTDESGQLALFRIEFAIPEGEAGENGEFVIRPTSKLPVLTRRVVIDGTTQAGYSGTPVVQLDGSALPEANVIPGLHVTGSEIRVIGLAINNFRGNGILLTGSDARNNMIERNFIGTDVSGVQERGNFLAGIRIANASNNYILNNLISGNKRQGIIVITENGSDNASGSNVIQGNLIGTDREGRTAIRNGFSGIRLENSSGNLIGGASESQGNVISGNGEHGVFIFSSIGTSNESINNRIQGNYIGTDVTRALNLGNIKVGVFVENSSDNVIGKNEALEGAGNVIAFNGSAGVFIKFGERNAIRSNSIFTNVEKGIEIEPDPVNPVVQDSPEIVSGAGQITGARLNAYGNLLVTYEFDDLQNNDLRIEFFKADADGEEGMSFLGSDTFPGGTAGTRVVNVGNPSAHGVDLHAGDRIVATATDPDGNTSEFSERVDEAIVVGFATFVVNSTGDEEDQNALDNACDIDTGSDVHECTLRAAIMQANAIPGADLIKIEIGFDEKTIEIASSLIIESNNGISGGVIIDATTQPGFVDEPIITLTVDDPIQPLEDGFVILDGDTTIRGFVVEGFGDAGIELEGNGTGEAPEGSLNGGSVIEGNFIRSNVADGAGDGMAGVFVNNSRNNRIGGDTARSGNVISANDGDGIRILGADATGNLVIGNYIGTNVAGDGPDPNTGNGILIQNARGNVIGVESSDDETTDVPGNVISGNLLAGITISGDDARNNLVAGNYIGTDSTGLVGIGNGEHGVLIDGASENIIGGVAPAQRNIISGNDGVGVRISGDASGNIVKGSYIGVDATGAEELPNLDAGVHIDDASGNFVGGSEEGAGNVISGNDGEGVLIDGDMMAAGVLIAGDNADGNRVAGNYIGVNSDGTDAIANLGNGVAILDGSDNVVGGMDEGSRNVISGNDGGNGVYISGTGARNNSVQGNYIGTDAAGMESIPNGGNGVLVDDSSSGNVIGGESANARNIISGNGGAGVVITDALDNTVSSNYIGTDVSGTSSIGNDGDGVVIESGVENTIGGPMRDDLTVNSIFISHVFGSDQTIIAAASEGVVRSVDRGNSWRPSDIGIEGEVVTTLAASPDFSRDSTVFAASPEGVFRSRDGGVTWSAKNEGLSETVVQTLAVSPDFDNDNTLFAGTLDGLFKSGNSGDTWELLEIAIDDTVVADAITAVALSSDFSASDDGGAEGTLFAGGIAGLYRSDDGGVTWEIVSRASDGSDLFTNLQAIALSPDYLSDATLFAGTSSGLFKSSDNGDSWSRIGEELEGANIQAIAVSPRFSVDMTLFVGTPDGVFRSERGGDGFTKVNNGLGGTDNSADVTYIALAPSFGTETGPLSNRTLYVGTSGKGMYRSGTGGDSWTQANRGLAGLSPGNLISGNLLGGVTLLSSSNDNVVQGNFIGTDAGGCNTGSASTCRLINVDGNGVEVNGSRNLIGDNVIAFAPDTGHGVSIESGNANEITSNYIFENGGKGISIEAGANGDPASPEIDNVRINVHNNVMVRYTLDVAPAELPVTVEFFIADQDGEEGKTFLFSDSYESNGEKIVNFGNAAQAGLDVSDVDGGVMVVATATNSNGSTSEFSGPMTLGKWQTFTVNSIADLADSNINLADCDTGGPVSGDPECTLRAAIQQANAVEGADLINFDLSGTAPVNIRPDAALPPVEDSVLIDGFDGDVRSVMLNGSNITNFPNDVQALAFSPDFASDQTVLFGTESDLLLSSDAGNSPYPANGDLPDTNIMAVAISPDFASDNTLIAGTASGVFVSSNGGLEWQDANGDLSDENKSSIQALVVFDNGTIATGTPTGLFMSADGGATWTDESGNLGTLTDTNIQALVVFGNSTVVAGTQDGLFVSLNRGIDWSDATGDLRDVSPDGETSVQTVALSSSFDADNTLVIGTPSGAFISSDAGATWTSITGNIADENIRAIGISPDFANDSILAAGNSSGVFVSTNAGVSWTRVTNDGLRITGGDSIVRGLIVNRFSGNGIVLKGNGEGVPEGPLAGRGTLIHGNIVGSDTTGSPGNGRAGILIVDSSNNQIGGTANNDANIITRNSGDGVRIEGAGSINNRLYGNLIGTTIAGCDPDVDSSCRLGNLDAGVYLNGSGNNQIGGRQPGQGNVIAFNDFGVVVNAGVNNAIYSNTMFENDELGISLEANGNNLQNSPVLGEVRIVFEELEDGSRGDVEGLAVRYSVDSPGVSEAAPLFVEFFVADADGDEGRTLVVRDTYTGGTAIKLFDRSRLSPSAIPLLSPGSARVVATATDPGGNTSQFSGSGNASSAVPIEVNSDDDDPAVISPNGRCGNPDGSDCTLRDAIIEANSIGGEDEIIFVNMPSNIISLEAPLPDITDTLTIDGASLLKSVDGEITGTNGVVELNGGSLPDIENVQSLEVSPDYVNDRTVFVGTDDGLFRSRNAGNNLLPVEDGLTNDNIRDVELSPNFANDGIAFAGTSNGLFRSTDGGDSWQRVSNLTSSQVQVIGISGAFATDGKLLVGTSNGLFRLTNGGGPVFGIDVQQIDDGLTDKNIKAIGVERAQSIATMFVGTDEGLFRSFDGGLPNVSWQKLGDLVNVRTISVSPNFNSDATLFAGTDSGVFRSTNNGNSFVPKNTGLDSTDIRVTALSPHFGTDGIIYAGTSAGVFRSSDRGDSWSKISEGLASTSVNMLALSPNLMNDSTLFAGTVDGMFRSENDGATWQTSSADGLRIGAGNSVVRGLRVSAFSGNAIVLYSGGGNVIEGNVIGQQNRGSDGAGVLIEGGSSGNLIGAASLDQQSPVEVGAGEGTGNIIAYNGTGVIVESGVNNVVRLNSIFSNEGIGIDLGGDGASPNDAADADSGANNLQNKPSIQQARIIKKISEGSNGDSELDKLVIRYSLEAQAPNVEFPVTIEFFISDSMNESASNHQGMTFIGSDDYEGGLSDREFTRDELDGINSELVQLFDGLLGGNGAEVAFIVATATDNGGEGNTSEFSDAVKVLSAGFVVDSLDDDPSGNCAGGTGTCTLRKAIAEANASAGLALVEFDRTLFDPESPESDRTIAIAAGFDSLRIEGSVIVDGDVNFDGVPDVIIDGSQPGFTDGLVVSGDGNEVNGLVIRQFDENGIRVEGSGNTIKNSVITRNGGSGVAVVSGQRNLVQSNSIFGNNGDGITLGAGANSGQIATLLGRNTAQVRAARIEAIEVEDPDTGEMVPAGKLVIEYRVDSPGETIEFFLADQSALDADDREGEILLDSLVTTADTLTGTAEFNLASDQLDFVEQRIASENAGAFIVATVTDTNGNTSRFSTALQVVSVVDIGVSVSRSVDSAANRVIYTVTVSNNGITKATDVELVNTLPQNEELLDIRFDELVVSGCPDSASVGVGGVAECTIGLVEIGNPVEVTLETRIPSPAETEFIASISVSSQKHSILDEAQTEKILLIGRQTPTTGPPAGGGGGGRRDGVVLPPDPVPQIALANACCAFTAVQGNDSADSPQTLIIRNDGRGSLLWGLRTATPWLSLSQETGVLRRDEQVEIEVSAVRLLSSRNISLDEVNQGVLTIVDLDGTVENVDVPVTLRIRKRAIIDVNRQGFGSEIEAPANDADRVLSLNITNGGDLPLDLEFSSDQQWIEISRAEDGPLETGASQTLELKVLVSNSDMLPPGEHTATVTIRDASDGSVTPETVAIRVNIVQRAQIVVLSGNQYRAEAREGENVRFPIGSSSLVIQNVGGQILNWELRDVPGWLGVGSLAGVLAPGEPPVNKVISVNPAELVPGENRAEVTIVDRNDARVVPETITFVVMINPVDFDEDGIGDAEENLAPNVGDANRDGIQDSLQGGVVSFLGSFGREHVTIESPEGKHIIDTGLIPGSPSIPGVGFPVGAFRFTLAGESERLGNGEVVDIRLLTFADFDSVFYQDAQGEWNRFDIDDSPSGSPRELTLPLQEGSSHDVDGVDGEISFIGALAVDTRADLMLAESGVPLEMTVVQPLQYTLTVVNNGPSQARNVVLRVNTIAEAGLTLDVSGSGLCAESRELRDTLLCELGDLDLDERAIVTITNTVSAGAGTAAEPGGGRQFSINAVVESDNQEPAGADANNRFQTSQPIAVTSPAIQVVSGGMVSTGETEIVEIRVVEGNPNPAGTILEIQNPSDGILRWRISDICDAGRQFVTLPEWLGIEVSGNAPGQWVDARGFIGSTTAGVTRQIRLLADIRADISPEGGVQSLKSGDSRQFPFYIAAPGDTRQCKEVVVNLTVLDPDDSPGQESVNLGAQELAVLKNALRSYFNPEGLYASNDADFVASGSPEEVWFARAAILAGVIGEDTTGRRAVSAPASARNASERTTALNRLNELARVLGNWPSDVQSSVGVVGDETLAVAQQIANILANPDEWGGLGILKLKSVNGDTLYVAYDPEKPDLLVHFESLGLPSGPANLIPGEVDAKVPVSGEPPEDVNSFFARDVMRVRATLRSPGELRVVDEIGRVAGLVNSGEVAGIPGSNAMEIDGDQNVFVLMSSAFDASLLRYEVIGTEQGEYDLDVQFRGVDETRTFRTSELVSRGLIPVRSLDTRAGQVDVFSIDWSTFTGTSREGWSLRRDPDGDGDFDVNYPVAVIEPVGRSVEPVVVIAAAVVIAVVLIAVLVWIAAIWAGGFRQLGGRVNSGWTKVKQLRRRARI